jgi:hypothetical protein
MASRATRPLAGSECQCHGVSSLAGLARGPASPGPPGVGTGREAAASESEHRRRRSNHWQAAARRDRHSG